MKKSRSLILSAIFVVILFACSKDSNVKLSLSNTIADADTTGFSGAQACYHTYISTIKDPPDNYIPGQAEIDLNTCLSPYGFNGGGGNPRKLLPPAPKVIPVRYPAPPDEGSEPDDNMRYINFFGLSPVHSTQADLTAAGAIFDHFSSIVCDALTENITFPNPSNIDKILAGVTYATNHPEVFVSDAERDQFLSFLPFVFQKPVFIISIGPGAIPTGINPFIAPITDCVNLITTLTF